MAFDWRAAWANNHDAALSAAAELPSDFLLEARSLIDLLQATGASFRVAEKSLQRLASRHRKNRRGRA